MTNQEFLESISLDGEIWKDVIGYEGLYMISSYGRLISLNRIVSNGKGVRKIPPRICKQFVNNDGYLLVNLQRSNKVTRRFAHRLVAESFIPNLDSKKEVDHINTIRTDNNIQNLRWTSSSENSQNPITLNRVRECSKKKSHSIVKIENDIAIEYFASIKEAARKGYNEQTIRRSLMGLKTPTKPYIWKYLSEWETSHQ